MNYLFLSMPLQLLQLVETAYGLCNPLLFHGNRVLNSSLLEEDEGTGKVILSHIDPLTEVVVLCLEFCIVFHYTKTLQHHH